MANHRIHRSERIQISNVFLPYIYANYICQLISVNYTLAKKLVTQIDDNNIDIFEF